MTSIEIDLLRNRLINSKLRQFYAETGLEPSKIPLGLNSVPFLWIPSAGQSYNMTFVGAIAAVIQDKNTLQVEAVTGWAVLENKVKIEKIKTYTDF